MANERRLVDADAAAERLRLESVMRYPQSWGMGLLAAMETLRSFPTVDAVEVCRCADCKNNPMFPKTSGKNMVWCRKWRCETKKADFCSYGEKREVE